MHLFKQKRCIHHQNQRIPFSYFRDKTCHKASFTLSSEISPFLIAAVSASAAGPWKHIRAIRIPENKKHIRSISLTPFDRCDSIHSNIYGSGLDVLNVAKRYSDGSKLNYENEYGNQYCSEEVHQRIRVNQI